MKIIIVSDVSSEVIGKLAKLLVDVVVDDLDEERVNNVSVYSTHTDVDTSLMRYEDSWEAEAPEESQPEPNEATQAAIKEVETGQGERFSSTEGLMADLNEPQPEPTADPTAPGYDPGPQPEAQPEPPQPTTETPPEPPAPEA